MSTPLDRYLAMEAAMKQADAEGRPVAQRIGRDGMDWLWCELPDPDKSWLNERDGWRPIRCACGAIAARWNPRAAAKVGLSASAITATCRRCL